MRLSKRHILVWYIVQDLSPVILFRKIGFLYTSH